jgi:hypothetical protein
MAKRKLEGELVAVDKTKQGADSAKKNFKGVSDSAKKASKKSAQAAKHSKDGLRKWAKGAIGLGAAYLGVSSAIGAFKGFMGESIALSNEQIGVETALADALRNTGQLTEESLQAAKSYASELQGLSVVGDEATIKAQAMGIAMGVTVDKLAMASEGAIGVSNALGVDLNTAMKQIAETTSGVAGRMAKVVPELGDLSKEALMAGEGIELINKKFAAFIDAGVNTYQGRMTQLGNAFGDMQEEVGKIITANPALIAAMGKAAEIVAELTGKVTESQEGMQGLVTKGIRIALVGLDAIVRVGEIGVQTFNLLKGAWRAVQFLIVDGATGFIQTLHRIAQGFVDLANLAPGVDLSNPLDATLQSMKQLRAGADEAFKDVTNDIMDTRASAQRMRNAIGAVDQAMLEAKRPAEALGAALGAPGDSGAPGGGPSVAGGADAATQSFSQLVSAMKWTNQNALEMAGSLGQADLSLGEFKATGELAAKSLRDQFAQSLFDVKGITQQIVSGLINALGELISFNKQAAMEFLQDQQFAARGAELAHRRAIERRQQAEEALLEARKSGEASALASARLSLEEAVLAEQQASSARKKSSEDLADARASAEEKAGDRIGRAVGQVLLQVVQQTAAAAVSQLIASLAIAEGGMVGQEVGKAGVFGLITAAAAGAALAGIFAGLIGRAKGAGSFAAADGGVLTVGRRDRDSVNVMSQREEAFLTVAQQRAIFGGLIPTTAGTTGGGLAPIDVGRARQMAGGGSTVIQKVEIMIQGAGRNADELARQLIPALRREFARGS